MRHQMSAAQEEIDNGDRSYIDTNTSYDVINIFQHISFITTIIYDTATNNTFNNTFKEAPGTPNFSAIVFLNACIGRVELLGNRGVDINRIWVQGDRSASIRMARRVRGIWGPRAAIIELYTIVRRRRGATLTTTDDDDFKYVSLRQCASRRTLIYALQ